MPLAAIKRYQLVLLRRVDDPGARASFECCGLDPQHGRDDRIPGCASEAIQ